MRIIHHISCLAVAATFISVAVNVQAQVKLGIEIRQGHDSPYISDIDTNGIAAAAGLMKNDHIKEISRLPVWFTYQVRSSVKSKKPGIPFIIVVKRGETLHSIKVDSSMPARSWPRIRGDDPLSDCYLSPTAACIIDLLYQRIKTAKSPDGRFSTRISIIEKLVRLDRVDLANAELKKAKMYYYKLSRINYSFGSFLRALNSLGKSPERRFLAYTRDKLGYINNKVNVNGLLSAASDLGKYGYKENAVPFVMQVVSASRASPELLKDNAKEIGEALAATEMYDQIRSYLKSKHFDSEWGSNMLEGAFLYHLKNENLKSAERVMKIMLTFSRSKTNKDDLIYIRLFHKARLYRLTLKLTEQLKKTTDEMGSVFQLLLARSVVKAYGARGSIRLGRKMISHYFKKNHLGPMLDLTIESANSRSTRGLAVQYYRDLPKLITDTYQLVKNANKKEKEANKSRIREFYLILSANPGSSFTIREYNSYNFYKYAYDKMVSALLEVRRYDEALAWTVAKERKFGNTWGYFDVFTSYGSSASPEKISKLKKHSKLRVYGKFFNRAYLKRLYWRGYAKDAAKLFNTLSRQEKEIAILGQIPFVTACKKCDL